MTTQYVDTCTRHWKNAVVIVVVAHCSEVYIKAYLFHWKNAALEHKYTINKVVGNDV